MDVLVIDDDKIFNFLSSKLLERFDRVNKIHTATNGQDAIDLLQQLSAESKTFPRLILIDINMPIMDGFTFIERFRTINHPLMSEITLVIVSSSRDPKDVERAKILNVQHYITKPITENSLKELQILNH